MIYILCKEMKVDPFNLKRRIFWKYLYYIDDFKSLQNKMFGKKIIFLLFSVVINVIIVIKVFTLSKDTIHF